MRIVAASFAALLMVAGLPARIVAGSHLPGYLTADGTTNPFGSSTISVRTGWPTTTYDLVRIGGWALLIFGGVIVAFALIREFRKAA